MGVPKFFRYISERYPNLSELVGIKEVSKVQQKKNCLRCKNCAVSFSLTMKKMAMREKKCQ